MIKIHLSRVLGEIRMSQRELAERAGIRQSTIGELYNELIVRVNLEHLDKICEVIGCSLCELLEYIPSSSTHTSENLTIEQRGNQKQKEL